jgi:hypothetical protein
VFHLELCNDFLCLVSKNIEKRDEKEVKHTGREPFAWKSTP